MNNTGGTFVVGVSTHQDPVLASLDLDLEPAAAGTLARIFHGFLGWTGKRPELARGLSLSDNALRAVLNVLEARGVAVRERFNVGGNWVYAIAVSDTPGLLPTRAELRQIFRNMADGDTTWTDAHQAVTPTRTAARSLDPALSPTCDDAASLQVTPCAENPHVNRFPLPSSAGPRRGMAAAGEPVNRLSPFVPESAEVRAHATAAAPTSRSVISTLEELQALAKLRGVKPIDGGRFRTSREVLAAAQALDPDMAEAGLAVLAHLDLPFWVAPEVWNLFGYGWTPDRVAALLADVHQAKSPHGAARYRLGKAAADEARGELAPPPAAPAATVDDLVERDANHDTPTWPQMRAADPEYDPADPADLTPGAAPWDRAAAERARHGFGWRAPAVPEVVDVAEVYRRQAEIRAESGDTEAPEGKPRAILDSWKAWRRGGAGADRSWVDKALATS